MTTPKRGLLFHFTHIDNLASVAANGLSCDNDVLASELPFIEVGHQHIKARRRTRHVPLEPGGLVADYVPFYFAARSPMLYAISKGAVECYPGGQDEVVYLVTSTDKIAASKLQFVFTDRNAAQVYAEFSSDLTRLGTLVDWPLMEARYFVKTDDELDRPERRMAEFLIHRHVPWSAMIGVGTMTESRTAEASAILEGLGLPMNVRTRTNWYF